MLLLVAPDALPRQAPYAPVSSSLTIVPRNVTNMELPFR